MGAEDYAELLYGILKEDSKYEQYLDQLITPSKDEKRKAELSTAAGAVVAHFIGVGWKSEVNRGAISFKETSPIRFLSIKPHSEPGKFRLSFIFPVSGLFVQSDFKKMQIAPDIEKVTNRVIGVRYDSDCTGKESICRNEALRGNLMGLFTTQRLCDVSSWPPAPITAEIARPESSHATYVGKVEVGVDFLAKEGVKLLFDTVAQIASIMTSTIAARGEIKPKETLMSPSPSSLPPPPPPNDSVFPHVPSRTCSRCGFRNQKGETICKRCRTLL